MKTVLLVSKDQDDTYRQVSNILTIQLGLQLVENADDADLSVVLGGDGTVLSAARQGLKSPVIVINTGHLGFLTSADPSNFKSILLDYCTLPEEDRLRVYKRTRRHMLDVQINGKKYLALNDVVVKNFFKLARVNVYADDGTGEELVSEYRADGLIIATPTGSTAYSLSTSGPIIHPHCHAYVVSPICPQGLTQRPLVLPSGLSIRLHMQDDMHVSIDGQVTNETIKDSSVVVTYNSHTIETVNPSSSYFQVLRAKLGWGIKPV